MLTREVVKNVITDTSLTKYIKNQTIQFTPKEKTITTHHFTFALPHTYANQNNLIKSVWL